MFFSVILVGQVEEADYDCSLGKQNAFYMEHIDADGKMVSKVLENALKQYGKTKRNRKAKEWTCEACQIGAVSSSPLNVYFKIDEGRNMVTSYVFFEDGEKFISSENDPSTAKAIKNMLMDVNFNVQREVIKKALVIEEKNLKGFEKDLSKLEKKNEDLHKDIEEFKEKILKAEKDIEQNLHDQEDKRMEIEKQRRTVEKVTTKLNNVGKG